MARDGVDRSSLHAWLSARSIARRLPLPVPDHGGFRVDTNSDTEIARWVFSEPAREISALARAILEPRYFIKLCAPADALAAALPRCWALDAPSYFMQRVSTGAARQPPDGYSMEIKQIGTIVEARILSPTGILAASGYAAETEQVFVYDRIVTEPGHRRKGLGHALMQALHDARRDTAKRELLVATEDGRALYSTLGWQTISPYSSASIREA